MSTATPAIPIARNLAEYAGIIACWGALLALWSSGRVAAVPMSVIIVLVCWCKTGLFGVENLRQLFAAARTNQPHHRFMLLMGVNMSQMILSYAFDFFLLYSVNTASFTGIAKDGSQAEVLFDFVYLSTLNFSFFGYSDILPQTIPARIVNLTEIALAFVTVIFMLSDFISLKESLRTGDSGEHS